MVLSIHMLLMVVIQIVIAGVILWLNWWLINYINPPEPFKIHLEPWSTLSAHRQPLFLTVSQRLDSPLDLGRTS